MSNISRRSFLKGAGVAALAVAAAGVLAGCSDKETPDTGAKRDVKLKYLSTSAGKVFGDVVIQVPALATTVSFATIQANKPAAAEGYDFISTEDGKIDDKGIVTINMVVKQAPKVEVQVKYMLVDFGTATELNATDRYRRPAARNQHPGNLRCSAHAHHRGPGERCCDQRHCYCLRLQEVRQLAEKALTHNRS